MAQQVKIEEKRYIIVNGPSRGELFDAVQYAYDEEKRFRVKFTTDDGHSIMFSPVGVSHEDGSGYSLNLSGYIREGYLPIIGAAGGRLCKLYYDVRGRQGCLTTPSWVQVVPEPREEW